jgi:hypothetical protein
MNETFGWVPVTSGVVVTVWKVNLKMCCILWGGRRGARLGTGMKNFDKRPWKPMHWPGLERGCGTIWRWGGRGSSGKIELIPEEEVDSQ